MSRHASAKLAFFLYIQRLAIRAISELDAALAAAQEVAVDGLRQKRELVGLSQIALSRRAGVSRMRLQLAEAGELARRARILEFFSAHLRERFNSAELHGRFGSSFRTRVSELNRDPKCPIRILNASAAGTDEQGRPCEQSVYWAESRHSGNPSKPAESEYMQRARKEEAKALPLFAGAPDA
jgi:transcriptional regulator with XRE-family HTH domain